MNKHTMITAAILPWGVASVTNAWADDSTNAIAEASGVSSAFKPKEGFFIGLQFANNFMDGVFDDSIYLHDGSSKLYDVPAVDNGMGFGAAFGKRFHGGALEISYQRTSHDTTSSFPFVDGEATYNVCDFNLKFDLTRTRLRPFIQVGFGLPWMSIKNGASDRVPYTYMMSTRGFYDETFWGVDVNIGAGLTYFITEHWALNAGLVYRWNWFLAVDDVSIDSALFENAINCTFGVSYTF